MSFLLIITILPSQPLIQIITMTYMPTLPPDAFPTQPPLTHLPSFTALNQLNHLNQLNQQSGSCEYRKKIQNFSFLLSDKIGKGYSSTVYKGLDDLTGQQVAIKVIELRSLRDETSKAMLMTQIECFRQVQHKYILRYINSYFTANNCYIVTEYCPGSDLAKYMKQKGRIREEEAAVLFGQIFEAYKALHQAGYVHRDLKPANIFVGQDDALRLADFGFSKKRTFIDRENYNVGTPIYMPRESLAANIYNEKTDTWALGITLYQMVCGEVPFRGRTEQQLRASIERGGIRFPEQVPVSAELKDFITRSLLNDTQRRLGVKEMEQHPWMTTCLTRHQSQVQVMSDSPERVLQDIDVRASLPHQAVHHNRSREYFDGGKENRRSVSTMQKLKLCMPKKGSQIVKNRAPLVDHALNINNNNKHSEAELENKENRPQNQSISSARTTLKSIKGQKDSSKVMLGQKDSPKAIEKVVSLMNYFRLLHRILEKVKQAEVQITDVSIRTSLQNAEKALKDRLASIFRKHMASLPDKSNKFYLQASEWSHFATSQRWQMYEFVIKRYQTKYSRILQETSNSQGEWDNAVTLFTELAVHLVSGELDGLLLRQRYMCMEVLSLMSHLCSLDQLILSSGWQQFTEKYANHESVLLESLSVDMGSYSQLEGQLRRVYFALKEKEGMD